MATTAHTTHTADTFQVWVSRERQRPDEFHGGYDYKVTETLDFVARTQTRHVVGTCEGERVNETHTRAMWPEATPEGAIRYRSIGDYTRIR